MFPDSKIVNKMYVQEQKLLGFEWSYYVQSKKYLIEQLSKEPYALVNDGSSDTGIKKMNVVCALIFHVNRSKQAEFKF